MKAGRPLNLRSLPDAFARARAGRTGIAVLVAAGLLSAVAGWMVHELTTAGPDAPGASETRFVSTGPVIASVPAGWRRIGEVPGIARLDSRTTIGFQVAAALPAYAVIAFESPRDPSLMSPSLRDLVVGSVSEPQDVRVAGRYGWRYAQAPAVRGWTIEVTVAPTTGGVLTIACLGSREVWLAADHCADYVGGLTLARGRWMAPDANLAMRTVLPEAMARLSQRRADIRTKLREARSPRAQRRLAARLAGAYERAARQLQPAASTSGPSAVVTATLRAAAAASRRLADAAGDQSPKRYESARRELNGEDRELEQALTAFG